MNSAYMHMHEAKLHSFANFMIINNNDDCQILGDLVLSRCVSHNMDRL